MKKRILFLELPRLDNDAGGPQEHLRLAGVYLRSLLTLDRVRAFQRQGAREIRFVDPSFKSHPAFDEIIRRIAAWNKRLRVKFFAD
ncbi:MAG: hypothetical protein WC381_05780 [Kiritimatiellia bacterium]|jgi:hypothetical protein